MTNPSFERGMLRAFAQQGLTPDRVEALLQKCAEKQAANWFVDSDTITRGLKGLTAAGIAGAIIPPAVALGGGYAAGRVAASGYDALMDQAVPKPSKDVEDFKADELARQMLNRMDRLKRKVKHNSEFRPN